MNVFLLETPMQIVNANEARRQFGLSDALLCVLDTGLFARNRFKRVIEETHWGQVRFIKFKHRFTGYDFGQIRPRKGLERGVEYMAILYQWYKRRKIENLARSIKKVEYMFLGGYRNGINNAMRHFANQLPYNRVVVLDDGTDTVIVNDQRKTEFIPHVTNVEVTSCTTERKVRFKAWLEKYVDWDTTPVPALTFFTCYDFDVRHDDRVVRNDYI